MPIKSALSYRKKTTKFFASLFDFFILIARLCLFCFTDSFKRCSHQKNKNEEMSMNIALRLPRTKNPLRIAFLSYKVEDVWVCYLKMEEWPRKACAVIQPIICAIILPIISAGATDPDVEGCNR